MKLTYFVLISALILANTVKGASGLTYDDYCVHKRNIPADGYYACIQSEDGPVTNVTSALGHVERLDNPTNKDEFVVAFGPGDWTQWYEFETANRKISVSTFGTIKSCFLYEVLNKDGSAVVVPDDRYCSGDSVPKIPKP
ncbi:uncharacterized protein UTRI_04985 [Ustilago trichophora]|uniref:Mig1 protein n=1 Tax=Ustilago trichophora TaxID=86804 RepID=A0A5C3EB45_9BASI|nr:uncharacterized protein UTRI_04985 [Ustilago trichophora]